MKVSCCCCGVEWDYAEFEYSPGDSCPFCGARDSAIYLDEEEDDEGKEGY